MPTRFTFLLVLLFSALCLVCSYDYESDDDEIGRMLANDWHYDIHAPDQRQSHDHSIGSPTTTTPIESTPSTSIVQTTQEPSGSTSVQRRVRTISEEHKRKISEAMRVKWQESSSARRRGKSVPQERREQISKSLRAHFSALRQNGTSKRKTRKPLSEEHKAKISLARKTVLMSDEARAKMSQTRTGKVQSPTTRAKIAESLRNKPKTLEHRRNMSEGKRRKKAGG